MPELSESTVLALDDFLNDRCEDNDGLGNVEMVDGFMCALAITPGGVAEDEWLPQIVGPDFKFASREEGDQVREWLAAFRADANRRVALDSEAIGDDDFPLLALPPDLDDIDPEETEELLGLSWAIGFYRALDLRSDTWDRLGEEFEGLDDDLDQIAELMMVGDSEESSPPITLSRRMEIIGAIPGFLSSFFAAVRQH